MKVYNRQAEMCWERYNCVIIFSQQAVDIHCLITGHGKVWFDDIEFIEIRCE